MKNLQPLSAQVLDTIDKNNDAQNLALLCTMIFNAPILMQYRPQIYEAAALMSGRHINVPLMYKIVHGDNVASQPERAPAAKTPCCAQESHFCQCNAD